MKKKSKKLFEQARKLIPGGVNSPVRAFRAVGGTPVFVERAKGAHFWDVEGRDYIDYCMSFGPLILGHSHYEVVGAVKAAAEQGMSYGMPTEAEVELAARLNRLYPSIEELRLVSSGTEAAMSAIRLARGFTGRGGIVKFDGGYHGHADSLLVSAGSGVATLGIPGCPGVPAPLAALTFTVPYNDLLAAEALFAQRGSEIASVIVEPVAGNMGVVNPRPGFLEGLRRLTKKAGALLIFDEVITGFRLALGGAQQFYNITPDLTVLGKILGGGLPIGGYGGRREIMEQIAPAGPVYQAGTLSGNPLATAAGLATIEQLERLNPYKELDRNGAWLEKEILAAARRVGRALTVNRAGSLLTVFFCEGPVENYDQAKKTDSAHFAKVFHRLLEEGIYLPPSNFEALFLSLAHGPVELEKTAVAFRKALTSL